jgi:hypothetical protein
MFRNIPSAEESIGWLRRFAMKSWTNAASLALSVAVLTASAAFAPGVHAASADEAELGDRTPIHVNGEVDAVEHRNGGERPRLTSLKPVDSIPAIGRLHSWSVVDNDRLIIWATPSRPYLVELFRPSPELRFAVSIGVTSFGSRIHAKFDSVEVDGFSYPIRRIYEMSRDEAKSVNAAT